MALPKNWKNMMAKLNELDGGIKERYNPFADVIQTPSPSVNFTFGKSHGLPRGYTMVTYGPPKGGKTTFWLAMMGQLHHDDPEAIAVFNDAEMRSDGQLTDADFVKWGIDLNRLIIWKCNQPDQIFDRFEKDVASMVQDGLPIKLYVCDSVNGIQGRRNMTAKNKSIMNMTWGDHAQTIQDGLKQILPVQRKLKIAVGLTAQVRSEMDETERMRGNTQRMAASFGLQHYAEYFMFLAPNLTVKARQDIFDQKFENEEMTDLAGNAEKTAHKIRAVMKGNSMAIAGRTAEFTLDYQKGIVNQFEEVFNLAVGRNVVERPNNRTYVFDGREWDGKAAFATALQQEPELCKKIMRILKERDLAGMIEQTDEEKQNAEVVGG